MYPPFDKWSTTSRLLLSPSIPTWDAWHVLRNKNFDIRLWLWQCNQSTRRKCALFSSIKPSTLLSWSVKKINTVSNFLEFSHWYWAVSTVVLHDWEDSFQRTQHSSAASWWIYSKKSVMNRYGGSSAQAWAFSHQQKEMFCQEMPNDRKQDSLLGLACIRDRYRFQSTWNKRWSTLHNVRAFALPWLAQMPSEANSAESRATLQATSPKDSKCLCVDMVRHVKARL